MILDAFSTLDDRHPALRPGDRAYVVAPTAAPAALVDQAAGMPRILGGLLPALGVEDGAFDAALAQRFWRGLLLAPRGSRGDLGEPAALARLARAPHLPVVVDCGIEGFSRPPHLAALLAALPPRPVVLTHGGQLNISGQHLEAARALFVQHPHTSLETSGIYRQDFLEDLLGAIGAERILYGSGHPRMDEDLEIERVRLLPADAAQLAAMLGGNARRLYGLDSGGSP